MISAAAAAAACVAYCPSAEDIVEGFDQIVDGIGNIFNNDEANDGPDVEIPGKIKDQAGDRGWTEDDIRDTVGKGRTGTASDGTGGKGKNPDPASVYGDKGGYVVVNDETGQVIQVSDKNDPDWIPDERINWDR